MCVSFVLVEYVGGFIINGILPHDTNSWWLVGQFGEPLVIHEVNIRGRNFYFFVGFWGLGGVPIDRKLLGDRFGRILSSGRAIFVHSFSTILMILDFDRWKSDVPSHSQGCVLGSFALGADSLSIFPWSRPHEHMPMELDPWAEPSPWPSLGAGAALNPIWEASCLIIFSENVHNIFTMFH